MCVLFVTWQKVSEEELKQQNFASPGILGPVYKEVGDPR